MVEEPCGGLGNWRIVEKIKNWAEMKVALKA